MQALATVDFRAPRIPVYSNVTGEPVGGAKEMQALLARQLVEPVQWENILVALVRSGKTQLFELGPGAQIKAMVKRVDTGAFRALTNIMP